MKQNSTAKISLIPAEAKALHRQTSAAIEHIDANPEGFKDDKDIFNDIDDRRYLKNLYHRRAKGRSLQLRY